MVAYGTSRIEKTLPTHLMIGNLSILNDLNLAKPTAFILAPASNLALLPWNAQHFACWQGFDSPVIGRLPPDMRAFVGEIVSALADVPTPQNPNP